MSNEHSSAVRQSDLYEFQGVAKSFLERIANLIIEDAKALDLPEETNGWCIADQGALAAWHGISREHANKLVSMYEADGWIIVNRFRSKGVLHCWYGMTDEQLAKIKERKMKKNEKGYVRATLVTNRHKGIFKSLVKSHHMPSDESSHGLVKSHRKPSEVPSHNAEAVREGYTGQQDKSSSAAFSRRQLSQPPQEKNQNLWESWKLKGWKGNLADFNKLLALLGSFNSTEAELAAYLASEDGIWLVNKTKLRLGWLIDRMSSSSDKGAPAQFFEWCAEHAEPEIDMDLESETGKRFVEITVED